MVAAFDSGDLVAVAEFVHPDYLDHQGLEGRRPITGIEGFAHVVETARLAYVELSVSVVDLIEGADRAAARIVWDGVRSSGERARRETIDIVRVVEGRAIEHWGGQT
jgi:predicted ester cyclase